MNIAVAMPTYITREIVKIWRRFYHEVAAEWPLFCDKWKVILLGLLFQYLHGVAARMAHYLHRPAPLLHDVGFLLVPELGQDKQWVSESVFSAIVFPFILWTFHPFLCNAKRFYTTLIWARTLTVLVICQLFRIASFTSTQLPGPNYHCREGSPASILPAPQSISEVIVLKSRYTMFGCGDLIFSSHMTFALVSVLTYNKFGAKRWLKQLSWLFAVALAILIIASRKHYSVDVVVAWYVVPLVFYAVDRHLISESEMLDRSPGAPGNGGTLLPLTMMRRSSEGAIAQMHFSRSSANGPSSNPSDQPLLSTERRGRSSAEGSPNNLESSVASNV